MFPRFGLEQYAAIDHVAPGDYTNRYVPEPFEECGKTALSDHGPRTKSGQPTFNSTAANLLG